MGENEVTIQAVFLSLKGSFHKLKVPCMNPDLKIVIKG